MRGLSLYGADIQAVLQIAQQQARLRSTTVMSLASLDGFWATVVPTCPAPRMMIFTLLKVSIYAAYRQQFNSMARAGLLRSQIHARCANEGAVAGTNT